MLSRIGVCLEEVLQKLASPLAISPPHPPHTPNDARGEAIFFKQKCQPQPTKLSFVPRILQKNCPSPSNGGGGWNFSGTTLLKYGHRRAKRGGGLPGPPKATGSCGMHIAQLHKLDLPFRWRRHCSQLPRPPPDPTPLDPRFPSEKSGSNEWVTVFKKRPAKNIVFVTPPLNPPPGPPPLSNNSVHSCQGILNTGMVVAKVDKKSLFGVGEELSTLSVTNNSNYHHAKSLAFRLC